MMLTFTNLKDLLTFNIKYYRYKNNLKKKKLAELCHLSSRYLTDIERGMHCPTIPKLEIIAKALNVEAYVLFQNPKRDKNIIKKMQNTRQYNQKIKELIAN